MPSTGPGHRPAQRAEELRDLFAIIFGCAGSRLTALIFDPGLGEAGVVRSAGHVIDYVVLGSFEPGVSALNIPMTVVLGPPSVLTIPRADRSGINFIISNMPHRPRPGC